MKNPGILIFFLTGVICSCNLINEKHTKGLSDCHIGTYEELIGSQISQAKNILEKEFYVKDTLLEDEGESWRALLCCRDSSCNSPFMLVETSWVDKSLIQRLSILGGTIYIHNDSIQVNSHVSQVKEYLSNEIPNAPDGYFFIKDKLCPNVFYEVETSEKDSLLYYGRITNIEQISNDAIITKIIIHPRASGS